MRQTRSHLFANLILRQAAQDLSFKIKARSYERALYKLFFDLYSGEADVFAAGGMTGCDSPCIGRRRNPTIRFSQ